ncbi:Cytochrome-c oxidase [Thalassoporum mexicanum PCC 7367]|uniref:cytochrome c oxidase subunit 3 n=1 Tax=Thalassoporum mexicanum TaxID=3457544 RepID=UPI00029FFDB8|nr:heme-copper oxidase subunit III [Pseudanabaena sp. PCC 7367]AFY68506.1 Cytochrome-c oxidase [Pseudanabaena sp. PCC 7367]
MQGSAIESTNLDQAQAIAAGEAHHEEHPDLRVFGLITFLISEGMLFLGLFAAYLAYRVVAESWPPEGTPELEILIPGINTIILVSSSFVIHQADHAIKKNDLKTVRWWFLATFIMGAVFIGGQLYEYSNLEFGLTSNLFASTFYVLTGFHGMHVMVGLCLILGVLLTSLKKSSYTSEKHYGIEAASIYWHFVDIVWIILFLMLYII